MNIFSYLVNADSTTGVKNAVAVNRTKLSKSFAATLDSGAAEVVIQASNDGVNWTDYLKFTPNVESPEFFVDSCPWPYLRANVTSVSGNLTVTVGN